VPAVVPVPAAPVVPAAPDVPPVPPLLEPPQAVVSAIAQMKFTTSQSRRSIRALRYQWVSVQQQRTYAAEVPSLSPMAWSHALTLKDVCELLNMSQRFAIPHPSKVTFPDVQPCLTHVSPMLAQ
jgi:hypothetical protein